MTVPRPRDQADTSGDHKLSKREIKRYVLDHPQQLKERFGVVEGGWKQLWASMDRDGDGVMDEDEWVEYYVSVMHAGEAHAARAAPTADSNDFESDRVRKEAAARLADDLEKEMKAHDGELPSEALDRLSEQQVDDAAAAAAAKAARERAAVEGERDIVDHMAAGAAKDAAAARLAEHERLALEKAEEARKLAEYDLSLIHI